MSNRGGGLLPDVTPLGFYGWAALLAWGRNLPFVARRRTSRLGLGGLCRPVRPFSRRGKAACSVSGGRPGLDSGRDCVPTCSFWCFWLGIPSPRLVPVRVLPAPGQPLRGPHYPAWGTGGGVLDLVAAVLVPLSLLGGVPQLGAQAVRAALQPPADCIHPLLPDSGAAPGLLLDLVHATPPRRCPGQTPLWSSAGTAGCVGGNCPGRARWRCRT